MKKGLIGSALASAFVISQTASAGLLDQSSQSSLQGIRGQDEGFTGVLSDFINFFLGFVGLLSVMVLIYGGVLMITAAGDPEKFGKGQKMIIYAIIGIIVIMVSWALVGTLIAGLGG